jgi:hypothetical protein
MLSDERFERAMKPASLQRSSTLLTRRLPSHALPACHSFERP